MQTNAAQAHTTDVTREIAPDAPVQQNVNKGELCKRAHKIWRPALCVKLCKDFNQLEYTAHQWTQLNFKLHNIAIVD